MTLKNATAGAAFTPGRVFLVALGPCIDLAAA
jgi:hypothetical protein